MKKHNGFNKKKYLVIPAVALATLLAGGAVSAHGFGGFMPKGDPQQMATQWEQRISQEAGLLGITADEMKSKWAEGKNLQQIAAEKGINQQQLHEKMKTVREAQEKEWLQTLVTQGKITQAQADARLQVMKEKQAQRGTMKGNHMGGKRGGGMGMGMMTSPTAQQ